MGFCNHEEGIRAEEEAFQFRASVVAAGQWDRGTRFEEPGVGATGRVDRPSRHGTLLTCRP